MQPSDVHILKWTFLHNDTLLITPGKILSLYLIPEEQGAAIVVHG